MRNLLLIAILLLIGIYVLCSSKDNSLEMIQQGYNDIENYKIELQKQKDVIEYNKEHGIKDTYFYY